MSDMPRCATCKWYEPDGDGTTQGYCGAVHIFTFNGAAEIDMPPRGFVLLVADKGDPSLGSAQLLVREDFGCIRHKPVKPDEPPPADV